MRYKVPQHILDSTECPKDYACLDDGTCDVDGKCEAIFTHAKNITVLKLNGHNGIKQQCPYAVDFSDRLVCVCPVRYYLFAEYKI